MGFCDVSKFAAATDADAYSRTQQIKYIVWKYTNNMPISSWIWICNHSFIQHQNQTKNRRYEQLMEILNMKRKKQLKEKLEQSIENWNSIWEKPTTLVILNSKISDHFCLFWQEKEKRGKPISHFVYCFSFNTFLALLCCLQCSLCVCVKQWILLPISLDTE